MNYRNASQRASDKRWDYTLTNDGRTRPIGYCVGLERALKIANVPLHGEAVDPPVTAETLPHADRYHADGHETAEEACSCYAEYQVDHHAKFRIDDSERTGKSDCAECGGLTRDSVEVGFGVPRRVPLCREHHHDRETVLKLHKVGSSASSY